MAPFNPERLADYRDYLRLLLHPRINASIGAKVDASDVVQDAMCRAHEAFRQFQGTSEGELVEWLRTILESALCDALRRFTTRKRDYRREQTIQEALNDSSVRLDKLLADSGTTPSRVVAKHEQAAQLAGALAALPEGQRTAVELHHLQGLSLAETAAQMARTQHAVAGLIRRGVIALKKEMQE